MSESKEFTSAVARIGSGERGSRDGPLSISRFEMLNAITHDLEGNRSFVLEERHRIREINHTTGIVRTLVGRDNTRRFKCIAIIPPKFRTISCLLVASSDCSIWTISTDGKMSLVCGHESKPGFGDGIGVDVHFRDPVGLTVDSVGRILVADHGNHAIRRIENATDDRTTTVTTITRATESWDADDIGDKKSAPRAPLHVCVDVGDTIYIADRGYLSIRRISATSGLISILADDRDALGNSVYMRPPSGITFEPTCGLIFFIQGSSICMVGHTNVVTILHASPWRRDRKLHGLVVESIVNSELVDTLHSNVLFQYWPPGLVAILATFLPRISLLAIEWCDLWRITVTF